MTVAALLTRDCTIVQRIPDGRDAYNNETTSTVEAQAVCELQQRQRTERTDRGEVTRTEWLLVLPASTSVESGDAVRVDDQTFEVFGDPWEARNPRTGVVSHIECTLVRTGGPDPEVGS